MELIETDIKSMGKVGKNRKYYVRIPKSYIDEDRLEVGKIYDLIFDEHIRIRDQIRISGTRYYVGIPKPYINKKTLEIGKIYEIILKKL